MGRPIFSNQFRLSQQTRMSDGPVFGEQIRGADHGSPRGLAGKPLSGFRATPSRRIPVLCGIIVYVIRFNNQLSHR